MNDIGLPQYKDIFDVETHVADMCSLNKEVLASIAPLHHVKSIQTAFQSMKQKMSKSATFPVEEKTDEMVEDWTAHCVVNWLKKIDLNEYVSNLEGAGIHGALMMRENTFTADVLADMLGIGSTDIWHREELCAHFNKLFKRDVAFSKWESTQKVKSGKISNFF